MWWLLACSFPSIDEKSAVRVADCCYKLFACPLSCFLRLRLNWHLKTKKSTIVASGPGNCSNYRKEYLTEYTERLLSEHSKRDHLNSLIVCTWYAKVLIGKIWRASVQEMSSSSRYSWLKFPTNTSPSEVSVSLTRCINLQGNTTSHNSPISGALRQSNLYSLAMNTVIICKLSLYDLWHFSSIRLPP